LGEVPEGSEFAARVYAAVNARDRGAIKALSAPEIVVGTTVEAYRGPALHCAIRVPLPVPRALAALP
jgi:hypothetical protein